MNIPLSEYLARPELSSSDLKAAFRSPAHYLAHKTKPSDKPTAAMNFGSACHAMILQPDMDMVIVEPKIDKRTKLGKEEYQAFLDACDGKIVVSQTEYDTIVAMRDAINATTWAKALLTMGEAEVSDFYTDPETGLACKRRFDRISDTLIIDYKTTVDASPDGFAKQAYNLGYYIQAAHYTAGIDGAQFVFVAQEKEPPYAAACYMVDGEFMAYGISERSRLINIICECQKANEWPGYPDEVQMMRLPGWVK